MGIYKNGRFWWVQVYIDGKRYRFSTGTENKMEAIQKEGEIKERLGRGWRQANKLEQHLTFAELAHKFLEHEKVYAESRKTYIFYQQRVEQLNRFFGPLPLAFLTRDRINLFIAKRREEVRPATVNRELATLRRLFRLAHELDWISANPLPKLKLLKEKNRAAWSKHRVLAPEEELALIQCPDYLRAIIVTALDTGMRKGEILAQHWSDMDMRQRVIHVTKSKTEEGEGREIPMTERLFSMLSNLEQTSEYAFTFKRMKIGTDIKKGWKAAVERAGIPWIRFQDLRHTFNTRLMGLGVVLDIRKALMGHSSRDINITYTHVELTHKREAIRRLDQWHMDHGLWRHSQEVGKILKFPQIVEK